MFYNLNTNVNAQPKGAYEIEMRGRERERWLALQIDEDMAEKTNRKARRHSVNLLKSLLSILAIW